MHSKSDKKQESTINSIKSWTEEDQPRFKLQHNGPASLTDAEILAILINTGTMSKSALDIAQDLLKIVDKNLERLGSLHHTDLQKVKGIGEAKSITIAAALELGRRRALSQYDSPQITSTQQLYNYMAPRVADSNVEELWLVTFGNNKKVITTKKLAIGGIDKVIIDARIVIREVLQTNATSFALIHNHPSGSANPSNEDKMVTTSIAKICKAIELAFLEHMIIGKSGNYYSFCDEGFLPT